MVIRHLWESADDERWAALRAPDPLRLPHIAAVLDRLAKAFSQLLA